MSTLRAKTNLPELMEVEYDDREFKRGEIYFVDLNGLEYLSKHVQMNSRPALIIQNDVGNLKCDTLIVALLTTKEKKSYPFQHKILLNGKTSIIMFEQLMTIDKFRLKNKIGELSYRQMQESEQKLMYSLGLNRLSLENIIGVHVSSIVTKKMKSNQIIFFEIIINFQNSVDKIITISLDKLHAFHVDINEDTPFEQIERLLDCCRGLSWLANNIEI